MWKQWMESLSQDQATGLVQEVIARGWADPKTQNGNSTSEVSKSGIAVERRPVEDFVLQDCPPYVDIHGLIPLYNKLCFRENLLVKGPKGDGKSLSIVYFAHSTNTPILKVKCSADTKDRHLTGSFVMRGNQTPFILGPVPSAIDVANEYGRAILVFEEVNSLTPQVQKQLNELLDFQRESSVSQINKTYRLRKGAQLWSVATMNPSVYGGTYDLNEDLRSRFEEVEVDYPTQAKEREIVKANINTNNPAINGKEFDTFVNCCIRLASETRQEGMGYALSSRDVVRLIRNVYELGLTKEESLQLLACKFENDDRDVILQRITSIFPKMYLKKSWGATR